MFEIFGKEYYIDVDKLMSLCKLPKTGKKGEEMDVFVYECYKTCIDRIIDQYVEEDGDMVTFTNKTDKPGFGISFNTLLKSEILKTNE